MPEAPPVDRQYVRDDAPSYDEYGRLVPQTTDQRHEPPAADHVVERESPADGGSLARVVAIVLSAGLAWATAVTLIAWILGRLLARG